MYNNASILTKYGEVWAWYPTLEDALSARELFRKRAVEIHPEWSQCRADIAWARSMRSARLKSSPVHITGTEFDELCSVIGYRCVYCGKAKPLTKDHLVAIYAGGLDDLSNVVPACQDCNSVRWLYDSLEDFTKHWSRVRKEAMYVRLWMLRHPEVVKKVEEELNNGNA